MISLVLWGTTILLCMGILIELIKQAVECTDYLEGFRILFYLTLVGVILGISASQVESAIKYVFMSEKFVYLLTLIYCLLVIRWLWKLEGHREGFIVWFMLGVSGALIGFCVGGLLGYVP